MIIELLVDSVPHPKRIIPLLALKSDHMVQVFAELGVYTILPDLFTETFEKTSSWEVRPHM